MAKLDYLPDFELSVSCFVNYQSRDGFGRWPRFAAVRQQAPIRRGGRRSASGATAEADTARYDLCDARSAPGVPTDEPSAARSAGPHPRPAREQTLGASEIGYQTGKLDFLADRQPARGRIGAPRHAAADAEFAKALADLELAVGEPIAGGDAQ
jgi:hypothetical protein